MSQLEWVNGDVGYSTTIGVRLDKSVMDEASEAAGYAKDTVY
jgi:hypothetical protein